jgi:hypothetical protein
MTYTTASLIADDDYAISVQPSGQYIIPQKMSCMNDSRLNRRG